MVGYEEIIRIGKCEGQELSLVWEFNGFLKKKTDKKGLIIPSNPTLLSRQN